MPNKSHAIVVGITRYQHYPELAFGRANADELALALEGLGFLVKSLLDGQLSRPSVLFDALDEAIAADADRILLYYCGYGITRVKDRRLLVAHPFSTPDRMRTHIDLADLATHLVPAHGSQIAIVLEAGLSELALIENCLPPSIEILSAQIDYQFQTRIWHKSGLSFFAGHMIDLLRQGRSFIPVLSLKGISLSSQRAHLVFCPDDIPPTFYRLNSHVGSQFTFWDDGGEGRIPRDLLYQFKRSLAGVREDAIQELADYYAGLDAELRTEAQEELLYLACEDASQEVRRLACEVLTGRAAAGFPIDWPVENVIETGAAPDIETMLVPAGEFFMGSTDETEVAEPEEKPQHKVYLAAFRIGKSPVTNEQYYEFCQRTGYPQPPHWTPEHVKGKSNHPVVNVSWYDAMTFCHWLTYEWTRHGKLANGEAVSLPTEAQWEKATRGADGRLYPWGDFFDPSRCNYEGSGLDTTTPVGQYSPAGDSPYGCQDVAGNVWEWTLSLWGRGGHTPKYSYPYDPMDGREDVRADETVRRVVRGGAFYYTAECVRCATRNLKFSWTKHSGGGFRIAICRSDVKAQTGLLP